jgi:hypothetical protein
MKIRIFSRTLRQADAILPKPQVQQLPAKACVEQHPCTVQAVHQTHFSTQCGESITRSGLVQRWGGRPPLCSTHVDHGKLAGSRHQKTCSRMHWPVRKEECSARHLWTLPPEPLQRRLRAHGSTERGHASFGAAHLRIPLLQRCLPHRLPWGSLNSQTCTHARGTSTLASSDTPSAATLTCTKLARP